MNEETKPPSRSERFRAAIADFIEARREAKPKNKGGDTEAASKYEYTTWLTDAASRAHNLEVVTHPIKFTHSAIKGGSSVLFRPAEWATRHEIGTHSLPSGFEEDFAISDARHLDVHSLLKEVVDGKRLLDWVGENDADLAKALHHEPTVASAMMASFRRVMEPRNKLVSNALAKQVYWLHGEDPSDDSQYHLLQPMFSSSLEQVVHADIRNARSAAFEARGTQKQKPTYAGHVTYPNLVERVIGGGNPQNVSPLNKDRHGANYLLASLPPPAWTPYRGSNMLKRDSAFEAFLWFRPEEVEVRKRVRALASYLLSIQDKTSNMDIQNKRDDLTKEIVDLLAKFGVDIRSRYPAGWTRDPDCRLPLCERLWLDPDRTELSVRDDADHPEWRTDDEFFNTEYDQGHWVDEVAGRFGNWLNARLRDAGLPMVAEAERKHWANWARQAILDMAWPIPLQHRTPGVTS